RERGRRHDEDLRNARSRLTPRLLPPACAIIAAGGSMKKAELEKLQGKKITGGGYGSADRFGKGAAAVHDKRTQREMDRQQGLVPFACKLHEDLVRQIQARALE